MCYDIDFVTCGLERASYHAAQEIRPKHLTREAGVTLVQRFDGEFPEQSLCQMIDCIEVTLCEYCSHQVS